MFTDSDWERVLGDYLESNAWRDLQESVARERQHIGFETHFSYSDTRTCPN